MKSKVVAALLTLAIVASVAGCGKEQEDNIQSSWGGNTGTYSQDATDDAGGNIATDSDATETTPESALSAEEEEQLRIEEFNAKIAEQYAQADDEYDYMFASDYSYWNLVKQYEVMDASGYDVIYGEERVTLEDIREVCDSNPNISQYYKDFIVDYAARWLELWPETDFRNFYHNLQTLQIHESTKQEIQMAAMALDTEACYLRDENAIYVLDGTDFSVGTDGYIVLTHELTHAARLASYTQDDGSFVRIVFQNNYDFGVYIEEALVTRFAYDMQGFGGEDNMFYLFCYNYADVILASIDYDGADYMNHSIYYLMDKMAECMGDREAARDIIAIQTMEASKRYESYHATIYESEQYIEQLHGDMVRLYMSAHFVDGMTMEEAELLYQDFMAEMTANLDRATRPIHAPEEYYREAFEVFIDGRVSEDGTQPVAETESAEVIE